MASNPNSSTIRAGSALNTTGHVNSVNKSSLTPSTVPSTFKSWKDPHELHGEAANAVISLILVIMVGFVVIMTLFFWRKYKHITLSVPTYQYSRLGQNDVDNDFADLTDHLGAGLSHSSSDDEMEPATLTVTTSQHSSTPALTNGNVALNSVLLEDSDEELLQ